MLHVPRSRFTTRQLSSRSQPDWGRNYRRKEEVDLSPQCMPPEELGMLPARVYTSAAQFVQQTGIYLPEGSFRTLDRLLTQPRFEQRTGAWEQARYYALTGTDCAPVLGIQFIGQDRNAAFEKKLRLKDPPPQNPYAQHGLLYEACAAAEVERRHPHFTIVTLGLMGDPRMYDHKPADVTADEWYERLHAADGSGDTLPGSEYRWLKGSPDGVVVDRRDGSLWLLEIKCPAGCIQPGRVQPYYYPQLQHCMHVMGLERSLFVQYVPPDRAGMRALQYDEVEVPYSATWWQLVEPSLRAFWTDLQRFRRLGLTRLPLTDELEPQEQVCERAIAAMPAHLLVTSACAVKAVRPRACKDDDPTWERAETSELFL